MNLEKLVHSTHSAIGPIADKAQAWLRASGVQKVAEHPWFHRAREWAQTYGVENRPAQFVGAAVLVGLLYVAVSDPLERPAPDDPQIVATRIAPIGTVNLAQTASPQLADQSDADSAAATIN
jgi:hypothetical protein